MKISFWWMVLSFGMIVFGMGAVHGAGSDGYLIPIAIIMIGAHWSERQQGWAR